MDITDHRLDPHTADGDSDSLVDRPVHDVSHVPDYPTRSLRSGRKRDEAGGEDCNVAFSSAGCSGAIQLYDCSIRGTYARPRTVGGRRRTGRICDLTTFTNQFRVHLACAPSVLGGFSIGSSRMAYSTRARPVSSGVETTDNPVYITDPCSIG